MNEPMLIENVLRDMAAGKIIPMRQRVAALEAEMQKVPSAKYLLNTMHDFGPGVYIRELHIPAGILLTGKIHKYECWSILFKGEIATFVDGEVARVKAPHKQLAPAGMKRVGYTYADTIWMTVHPNPDNCKDVEELERRHVCDTERDYQAFLATQERMKCLS